MRLCNQNVMWSSNDEVICEILTHISAEGVAGADCARNYRGRASVFPPGTRSRWASHLGRWLKRRSYNNTVIGAGTHPLGAPEEIIDPGAPHEAAQRLIALRSNRWKRDWRHAQLAAAESRSAFGEEHVRPHPRSRGWSCVGLA